MSPKSAQQFWDNDMDPAAPAALALASRWKEPTAAITGRNQDVKEKLRNIQRDAWADAQTEQT